MVIKKTDMASRVSKAADSSPDIAQRLRHAREVVKEHPLLADNENVDTQLRPQLTLARDTTYRSVDVDLIDPNPYNARRIYLPERVNALAASIGAHGQDVPGIATYRDGRYLLAAGHYRLRAIKTLGLKTMNLMIHENLTDKDLYAYSYRENAEREGQTALDNALCWRDLLDSKIYSSETDLAEATGLSLPNINKTLRILSLSESVLEIVREDPAVFPLSALYELALLEAAAQSSEIAIELAMLVKSGDAGRKEIQEARSRLENPRKRKPKETSRQYKIYRGGQSIGFVKGWDSGRIALDVVIGDPAERNDILELLKTRFGISE